MTEHEMNYATDLASLVNSKVSIDNVAEHIDYLKNNLSLDQKGFILVCAHATYMLDKENDLRNIDRLISAFGAASPSSTSIKIAEQASSPHPDTKILEKMVVSSVISSKSLHDAAVSVINSIRLANGRIAQRLILIIIQKMVSKESLINLC